MGSDQVLHKLTCTQKVARDCKKVQVGKDQEKAQSEKDVTDVKIVLRK